MANNIRELRKERGWSLRELAERMEAHFTTIAKLENSQRKLTAEWRSRFAEAFGVFAHDITDPETHVPNFRDWSLPIISMSNGKNWRDVKAKAENYIGHPDSLNGSDWQFVLEIDQETGNVLFPIGSFVYVDPEQRNLVQSDYYAILLDGRDIRFGVYFDAPPRFEWCVEGKPKTILSFGHEPFVTVGKLVGVYHRLSVVARGSLHPN